jgi:hypothetical protein
VIRSGEFPVIARIEGEWIGYVSLLVQTDRIAADIRANLPLTE